MAEFMRQHAQDFILRLRLLQQSRKDEHLTPWKGEGVWRFRGERLDGRRHVKAGRVLQAFGELHERGRALGRCAVLAVEHLAHLPFGHFAETFFPRNRHERRQAVCGEGNAEPNEADNRSGRGERPATILSVEPFVRRVIRELRAMAFDFALGVAIADVEMRQFARAPIARSRIRSAGAGMRRTSA